MLCLDNGGEYTSIAFNEFCSEERIKSQLEVPYTQHQNGIVERKNESIVGGVRVILHDQSLPLFLWIEACNIVVYI